jgi:transcriptional regulator GlxA family with amidase domain
VAERWVTDGRILTGGGVAAGIDMALHLVQHLAGEQVARTVQLNIEYDPQPPLGGIDWASPAIPAFKPQVEKMLKAALSGQPELLDRLIAVAG